MFICVRICFIVYVRHTYIFMTYLENSLMMFFIWRVSVNVSFRLWSGWMNKLCLSHISLQIWWELSPQQYWMLWPSYRLVGGGYLDGDAAVRRRRLRPAGKVIDCGRKSRPEDRQLDFLKQKWKNKMPLKGAKAGDVCVDVLKWRAAVGPTSSSEASQETRHPACRCRQLWDYFFSLSSKCNIFLLIRKLALHHQWPSCCLPSDLRGRSTTSACYGVCSCGVSEVVQPCFCNSTCKQCF